MTNNRNQKSVLALAETLKDEPFSILDKGSKAVEALAWALIDVDDVLLWYSTQPNGEAATAAMKRLRGEE